MALIPLTPQTFAGQTWRPMRDSAFARNVSLVELNASEMPAAACQLPVGFVKNADGQLGLHAVLGVQPGKNLFVAADGSWLGGYWPLRLRLAPFMTAKAESGEFVLCVEDGWWQPAGSDGYPFYSDHDTLAPQTAGVLQDSQTLMAGHVNTVAACAALEQAQLVKVWDVAISTEQGSVKLEGLLCIDEEALNRIDAHTLQSLRDSGALALAYCQLISMQHLRKLAELADAHARLEARANVATPGADLKLDFLDGGTLTFGNA